MDINGGSKKSIVMNRMMGTKVRLAGRTMFLPNSENAFVRQNLTLAQIEAIPRDRYVVAVIESSTPLMSGSDMKMGRFGVSTRKHQRYRMGGNNRVVGFISQKPPDRTIEESGTKTYDTIITLLNAAVENTKLARDVYRKGLRNQKDAKIPDSGIFVKPIDEDKLSDCIHQIIDHYFGTGDTTRIDNREYKLAQFCVLIHFFFIRIGFLENESRQAFCLYLINKVFCGHERFTVRTFNNYANQCENVKENLTHADRQPIDFNTHRETSGQLQDAFHEIGSAFQRSQYFQQLREQRNKMNSLLI